MCFTSNSNINYVYSLANFFFFFGTNFRWQNCNVFINYYKKESDEVCLYLLKSFNYYYYLVFLNYVDGPSPAISVFCTET